MWNWEVARKYGDGRSNDCVVCGLATMRDRGLTAEAMFAFYQKVETGGGGGDKMQKFRSSEVLLLHAGM